MRDLQENSLRRQAEAPRAGNWRKEGEFLSEQSVRAYQWRTTLLQYMYAERNTKNWKMRWIFQNTFHQYITLHVHRTRLVRQCLTDLRICRHYEQNERWTWTGRAWKCRIWFRNFKNASQVPYKPICCRILPQRYQQNAAAVAYLSKLCDTVAQIKLEPLCRATHNWWSTRTIFLCAWMRTRSSIRICRYWEKFWMYSVENEFNLLDFPTG